MRAMILAAGRGQRMRPLTDRTPKPLLPVGGRPLIEWHICRLAQAGFREVVVNHAWLGDQIATYLGNGSRWNMTIHHSPETVALETAGGIAQALHLLGRDPFLVINGDVWTDWDMSQARSMAKTLQDQPSLLAALVLVPNPPQHPDGDFALATDGILTDRPPLPAPHLPCYTFSGIGVYQPELFADTIAGTPAPLAPLLRRAMQHKQVIGSLYQGAWHDIGTVERLAQLDQALTSMELQPAVTKP